MRIPHIHTMIGLWRESRLLKRRGNRCNNVNYQSGPEYNRECERTTQEQLAAKHKTLTEKKTDLVERMDKLKATTKLEKEWEAYKQQFINTFQQQEYQYQQSMGGCRQFHQQRLESIVQNYEQRITERETPVLQKDKTVKKEEPATEKTQSVPKNDVESLGNNTWAITISPDATLQLHFKSYVQSTDLLPQMTSLQTQDYFVRRDPQNRNRIIISSQNTFTYKAINGTIISNGNSTQTEIKSKKTVKKEPPVAKKTEEPEPLPRKPAQEIPNTPAPSQEKQIPVPPAEKKPANTSETIPQKTAPAGNVDETPQEPPTTKTPRPFEPKRRKLPNRTPTEERIERRPPADIPLPDLKIPDLRLPDDPLPEPKIIRPDTPVMRRTPAPTPEIPETPPAPKIPKLPPGVIATIDEKTGTVTLSMGGSVPDQKLEPTQKEGRTIVVSEEEISRRADWMIERKNIADWIGNHPHPDKSISFILGKDNRVTVKFTTLEGVNNPVSIPIVMKKNQDGTCAEENSEQLRKSADWLINIERIRDMQKVARATVLPVLITRGVSVTKGADKEHPADVTITVPGAVTRVLKPTSSVVDDKTKWEPVLTAAVETAIKEMIAERAPVPEPELNAEKARQYFEDHPDNLYEFNPSKVRAQTTVERQNRKQTLIEFARNRTQSLFGANHPYNKEKTYFDNSRISAAVQEKVEDYIRKISTPDIVAGKSIYPEIRDGLHQDIETFIRDVYYASLALGAHKDKLPSKPTEYLIEKYIKNTKYDIGGSNGEVQFQKTPPAEFYAVSLTFGVSNDDYRRFFDNLKGSLTGMLAEYDFEGWSDASKYPARAQQLWEIFRKTQLRGNENTHLLHWMMHRLRELEQEDGVITDKEWDEFVDQANGASKEKCAPPTGKMEMDYPAWTRNWKETVRREELPSNLQVLEGRRRKAIDDYYQVWKNETAKRSTYGENPFEYSDKRISEKRHLEKVLIAFDDEIAAVKSTSPDLLIYMKTETPFPQKLLTYLEEDRPRYQKALDAIKL